MRFLPAWTLFATLLLPSLHATDFHLVRAIGSGESIPNQTGTLDSFPGPCVALSHHGLCFRALNQSRETGIYWIRENKLIPLVQRDTQLSESSGTYKGSIEPRVFGEYAVLKAGTSEGLGIFVAYGKGIQQIADKTTTIPGTDKIFSGFFSPPTISSEGVAFIGDDGDEGRAVYWKSFDAPLILVARAGQAAPGSDAKFSGHFTGVSAYGDALAFIGNWEDKGSGIYRYKEGTISPLVDVSTPIPGSAETFIGFGSNFCYDKNGITFRGNGPNGLNGIYRLLAIGVVRVADSGMTIPERSDTFTGFDLPNSSYSGVAFRGRGPDGFHGVYYRSAPDQPVEKVLATGDTLDGKEVTEVRLGPGDGMMDTGFAIAVDFKDETSAIYLVSTDPAMVASLTLDEQAESAPASTSAGAPATAKPTYASIPPDRIYEFIKDITLNWSSTSRNRVAKSQFQVYFNDTTGKLRDPFFAAIEDINAALGYEKFLPQLTTKTTLEEGHVLVYLGPYDDTRRLLREAGGRGGSFDQSWSGWFWWDADEAISKAVVGMAIERLSSNTFPYYLRESLLTSLGYSGHSRVFANSVFATTDRSKADPNVSPISDLDRVILRFCDVHLATDSSRGDMRKTVAENWLDFAQQEDKKQ